MAIKIRRGLDADRLSVVFDQGEIVYTTDTKLVFIGDGVTPGGNPVSYVTYASIVAALGYVPADDAVTVKTTGLYANPSWLTSLAWGKITGTPTTLSGYGITDAVLSSRTLTINGVSYDLTANRSWSVGTYSLPGGGTTADYIDGTGALQVFPTLTSADKMITVGRNATGSTLYKGTVVYISGSTGNKPNFVKAQANSEATSAGTFGVIYADIANNADGQVVTIGTVDNLDTRSTATHPFTDVTLADGDTVYLHPTIAGYITNVKPYAPYHLVYVGKVTRTSPTNGTIVYRIQNGYELDELHDVAAQTPSNNDGLFYESSTSLWKNKSISTVLGFTPIPLTGLSASSPLAYNNTTGAFSIQVANGSQNGYLSSTDWTTFNGKQGTISLTTTGSSGASTFAANILNIPTYTLSGLGGVPSSRTLTINGTTYDLSANRSWTISTATPTLDQVTTAGNITTNGISVGTITGSSGISQFKFNTGAGGVTPTIAVGNTDPSGKFAALLAGTVGSEFNFDSSGWFAIAGDTKSNYTGNNLGSGSETYYFRIQGGTGNIQINTTTDAGFKLDVNGSIRGTSVSIVGGTSSQFLKANGSIDANTYLTSAITSLNGLTGTTQTFVNDTNVTMVSTGTTHTLTWSGTLADSRIASSTNWNTAYTNRITSLTTTGSSGSSTFAANVLNIPTYTLSGLGGQPLNANLTSISALTFASTSFVKMTASGTFALDTNTYLTAESDTLASVTGRGNTTTNAITVGGLTVATNLIYTDTVNGRVGIGTSSPIDKLEIIGATTTSFSVHSTGTGSNGRVAFTLARVPSVGSTTETGWQFLKDASDNFSFRSISSGTATDRMYLFTSGNVGIGTTSTDAGYKLDVNGTVRIQNQLTTTGSITAASAIALGVYMNNTLVAAANNDVLVGLDILPTFNTGSFTGVTNYYLRAAGNVQLGKIYAIGVTGNQASGQVVAPGSGTAQLILTSENHTGFIKEFIMTGRFKISTQYFGNAVYFGNGSTTYTIFTDTNNFAIGSTTDAGYKLDVNGTARIQNQLTTTGSITASTALARGVYMNNTLVAAANNDVLVGLDISPTFTNGAFTGVANYGIRTNNSAIVQGQVSAVSGAPTATPSTTGGTLVIGTYYYKIVAVDGKGNTTIGSTEVSATTTTATASVVLGWTAVQNASSYRIYRGTVAGTQTLYYTSTTNSYTDINAASTAGTVPTVNTTYLNGLLTTGKYTLEADSTVTTQTSSVIQSSTTNANLVIAPNGTGALVASIPDGTATGGNARGTNAVDLQTTRTAATNIATGVNSTISGGASNTASSNYSTVSGGQSNTASTNAYATVVGGQNNTASGLHSVTGGASNTASGQASFVANGGNTASGGYSAAFGFGTNVSGNNSFAVGAYGLSYLTSQSTIASGRFTTTGDAQQSLLTARKQDTLTTGATTVLSLDGTGVTNLIIPNGNNRAWNVQINTIAVVTTITGTATGVSVGDVYSEVKNLLFKRIGGTSSIVGTVDTSNIKSNTSMSTALLTIIAGASQEMAITFTAPTFTGGGSVTCRVVSKVSLVEVAY